MVRGTSTEQTHFRRKYVGAEGASWGPLGVGGAVTLVPSQADSVHRTPRSPR